MDKVKVQKKKNTPDLKIYLFEEIKTYYIFMIKYNKKLKYY